MSDAAPASTCPPGNQLPSVENLPIPQNVSFAVIPGSNTSDSAMVACCAPNPVHIAEGCYEWCEAPPNNPDAMSFGPCLVANHRDLNKSSILGFHAVGAAQGRASPVLTVAGLSMWVLVVSGVAGAVFGAVFSM
ncbi:MAG: hypothetical protein STHCBS139747_007920 [Sporothrix thermara]